MLLLCLLGCFLVYLHATTEKEREADVQAKEAFAREYEYRGRDFERRAPANDANAHQHHRGAVFDIKARNRTGADEAEFVYRGVNFLNQPMENKDPEKVFVYREVSNVAATLSTSHRSGAKGFAAPAAVVVAAPAVLAAAAATAAGASSDEHLNGAEHPLHVVVSSDCSTYQRWQVLTQAHSALAVGQNGNFTWIVSGCAGDRDRAAILAAVAENFPATSSPLSSPWPWVHFTPDFSDMSVYGGRHADGKVKRTFLNRKGELRPSPYGNRYKFNNKPNGLLHWATAPDAGPGPGEMVVLVDPDFMFLAPLSLRQRQGKGGKGAGSLPREIGAGAS